jgi:negative regulator of genetic competence, sporulation and motility
MYIEQVDENKIKATLESDDLKMFGVTYESMDCGDKNTRKMCTRIMSIAKERVGFCLGDAKLLVEAKKVRDNLIVLYLSKESTVKDDPDDLYGQLVRYNNIDGFLDSCKCFGKYLNILESNTLYFYNDQYYLYFEVNLSHKIAKDLLHTVLEYGELTNLKKDILDEQNECIIASGVIERVLSVAEQISL